MSGDGPAALMAAFDRANNQLTTTTVAGPAQRTDTSDTLDENGVWSKVAQAGTLRIVFV